jgi:hypothetical protein
MTMSGGKFQRNNVDNTKDAVKGMKKSGKFYKIDRDWFGGISRREKPSTDPADVKDRTTSDALAGSNEEIYSYMNDTFMPRMKQQMEAMVDDIYANLRRLGTEERYLGAKTEQQQALDMAKAIENIANSGFSRSTMALFLRSMDKEHHGFGSIPNNERELRDILKNEPNARAKWAKTVLDAAKAQHDAVKNMISAPMMNALKGQGVAEGHADQQRTIVKKNGKPVGEIGIDRESSPGAGMYYMKHYASGLDLGGYDSREEALDELRYAIKQGVSEAMKPSDIPPSMRDRLTMRDIEAERPEGAFRFRVTFPDGHANDYMTFDAAQAAAEQDQGRITRLSETQKKTAHRGARGTNPRLERILKMLRATHPTAQNDLEALILDFRSQQAQDRTDIARLDAENDMEEADIDRLEQLVAQLKQRRAMATESLRDREYHVATVTLDDGTTKKVRITTDEGFRDRIQRHFEKQGRTVTDIDVDYSVRSDIDEAKKKPQPTNPELWSRAKAAAKSKFDVYPSAYANAWAAKWYKSKGGGWRMGKPKKK